MKKLIILFLIVLFGFGGYCQSSEFNRSQYFKNIEFVDDNNDKSYYILNEGNYIYPHNGVKYAKLTLESKYGYYVHINEDFHVDKMIGYSISKDGKIIALLKEDKNRPIRIDIYYLPYRGSMSNSLIKTYNLVKLGVDDIHSFSFDKNNNLIINSNIGIVDHNVETCNH